MWQLVAPHKSKHIIIHVFIDGPTFSLLPMELRRDETVETIPPAVDTLCARRVGNLGGLFLETPFPSELKVFVANSHSLDIPGHGLDRFRPSRRAIRKQGGNPGGAEAAKQRRIHQLLSGLWWGRGARRDQLDRQALNKVAGRSPFSRYAQKYPKHINKCSGTRFLINLL